MRWKKLGLIFCPQGQCEEMSSHAAVPIAQQVKGSRYRIYYSARNTANRSLPGWVEIDLDDPQQILSVMEEPFLALGKLGCFDEDGVMPCWIVSKDGMHYLYYIGWNRSLSVPFRNALGLAVSDDGGRTFTKYSCGPILDRSTCDPCFVASCSVLCEPDGWRMWYLSCVKWEMQEGKPVHCYHIKCARSDDGIRWEREGVVCIDFQSAEEYAISRPSVVKDNGVYKMWYSYRGKSYRIGYAESFDGTHWTRMDTEVGIGVSGAGWDSEMIEYPFIFDHSGHRYMLYNGNGYGRTGFGLAVLEKSICP